MYNNISNYVPVCYCPNIFGVDNYVTLNIILQPPIFRIIRKMTPTVLHIWTIKTIQPLLCHRLKKCRKQLETLTASKQVLPIIPKITSTKWNLWEYTCIEDGNTIVKIKKQVQNFIWSSSIGLYETLKLYRKIKPPTLDIRSFTNFARNYAKTLYTSRSWIVFSSRLVSRKARLLSSSYKM